MKTSYKADDISGMRDLSEADLRKVIRSISLEAFSRIIKKTPVDTGRARQNWFCTLDKPSKEVTNDTSKDAGAVITDASKTVKKYDLKNKLYLSNNVPYIQVLENGTYPDGDKTEEGYSKQAPEGMVKITMAEMDAIIKDAFKGKE